MARSNQEIMDNIADANADELRAVQEALERDVDGVALAIGRHELLRVLHVTRGAPILRDLNRVCAELRRREALTDEKHAADPDHPTLDFEEATDGEPTA